MHPYRVFVSYSREDRTLAESLVDRLGRFGLNPVWDCEIRPAERFSEAIKQGIAHAHVFMPILTREGARRPWVHQETGYAIGLEVPVLPLAVGGVPGGMIRELQALRVGRDLRGLSREPILRAIEGALKRRREETEATFRLAALPEMRAELLADYTCEALDAEAFGPLRQSGAFTSFCLPDAPPDDPIWRRRDGKVDRSEFLHGRLHDERQALEQYVRAHGADLEIYPKLRLGKNGPAAKKVRLTTLLEFLEDSTICPVRVLVRERSTRRNLTLVGDWFSAESVTPRPGKGYHHTVFTWHARTVLEALRTFDRHFERRLERAGLDGPASRAAAVEAVRQEIERLG
ncbi:MAG: toll/interleukin-1 receptor domain-containing protein [Planctomycetota bacterium]